MSNGWPGSKLEPRSRTTTLILSLDLDTSRTAAAGLRCVITKRAPDTASVVRVRTDLLFGRPARATE